MHTLKVLPGTFAVCRLDAGAPVPDWAFAGDLGSVTRTAEELSVVCPEAAVPEEVQREGGWRVLGVAGPLDFGLTGILAGLTAPLAAAGITVCALSTFDTDYLMVKDDELDRAVALLREEGHRITP